MNTGFWVPFPGPSLPASEWKALRHITLAGDEDCLLAERSEEALL